MLHPQSSSQRSVCLDHDVVLMAERRDLCASIEWMDFDLIDGWMYAWLGCKKFLQLVNSRQQIWIIITLRTHMLDAKIANASCLYFSILDSILYCLPALQSLHFSAIWTV